MKFHIYIITLVILLLSCRQNDANVNEPHLFMPTFPLNVGNAWAYNYFYVGTPVNDPITASINAIVIFEIESQQDSLFILSCKINGVKVIETFVSVPPYTVPEYRYDTSFVNSFDTYKVGVQTNSLVFLTDEGYDRYGLQDFSMKYRIPSHLPSSDTLKLIDTTINPPAGLRDKVSVMKFLPGVGIVEKAENKKGPNATSAYYKLDLVSYDIKN